MNTHGSVHRWGDSDRWIVDLNGHGDDQPRTESELQMSGHWFGPFNSEQSAADWLVRFEAKEAEQ